MRDTLDSIPKDHPLRRKLHCLLSYDVPSRAELSEFVGPGDEVFLCTDVISTATLVRELVSVIGRIGANIAGIIALVDARNDSPKEYRGFFAAGALSIPTYIAASMNRNVIEQPKDGATNYWVDPVSAVPLLTEDESTIEQEKISRAVELLSKTQAFAIGHFVDGLRHMSLRIDVKKLLSSSDAILTWTKSEYETTISRLNWDDFDPRVAFVPAGVRRIDTLPQRESDLTDSQPASEIYAALVSELFGGAELRIVPVPRSFEPGGQPKCASIDYIRVAEELDDIVLVDDGISSGGTIRSLIHHAVRAGAKRILVFALLARTTPADLDQWKLTREMARRDHASFARIGLVNPLHLPIPFSGSEDCSQCSTLRRLESRSSVVSSSLQAIEDDLRAPYEYECSGHPREFREAWIAIHTLAESSSWSMKALEELRNQLVLLENVAGPITVHREAAIRLFLVEWRLLGKSRLRQVIRPIVKRLAEQQLADTSCDLTRRLEALSLLRSLFPEDYRRHAIDLINASPLEPEMVERLILHLETLANSTLHQDILPVLRQLSSAVEQADHLSHLDRTSYASALESTEALIVGGKNTVDISARMYELSVGITDSEVKHYVLGTLVEITQISPSRFDALLESGWFSHLSVAVNTVVIPTLQKQLIPLFQATDKTLINLIGALDLEGRFVGAFSEVQSIGVSGCLAKSMDTLQQAFKVIENRTQGVAALRSAISAANGIRQVIFGSESPVKTLIDAVTTLTADDIVTSLVKSMSGVVPAKNITITHVNDSEKSKFDTDKLRVLVSEQLISKFSLLTTLNLNKHVFDKGAAQSSVRIRISYGAYSEAEREYLVFRIENTHSSVNSIPRPKWESYQFNKVLADIDGDFLPASPSSDDFGNASQLKLRTYMDGER